jgi:hypothetical protein
VELDLVVIGVTPLAKHLGGVHELVEHDMASHVGLGQFLLPSRSAKIHASRSRQTQSHAWRRWQGSAKEEKRTCKM